MIRNTLAVRAILILENETMKNESKIVFFNRGLSFKTRPDALSIKPLIGTGFICVVFSLFFSASLSAQSLTDEFGGFSASSNEPIDIVADQLQVNDITKTAIFSGDVKAVQGDFELRSKRLEVFYSGTPQGGTGGKVKRLVAKGKVLITTKDNQSATSEWANFDVIKQIITLGDQVVLTQGSNIINGGQLQIDLKTRQSKFINKRVNGKLLEKGKKGRVRMKVDVKSQKNKKAPF